MYIKNKGADDLQYSIKDYLIILTAGEITYIDESVLTLTQLTNQYGDLVAEITDPALTASVVDKFATFNLAYGTVSINVEEAIDEASPLVILAKEYIQRVEDTGTYTYIGKAEPSSTSDASVWQIKRVDVNGNKFFASGVATYTQVWDNRISLEYA